MYRAGVPSESCLNTETRVELSKEQPSKVCISYPRDGGRFASGSYGWYQSDVLVIS